MMLFWLLAIPLLAAVRGDSNVTLCDSSNCTTEGYSENTSNITTKLLIASSPKEQKQHNITEQDDAHTKTYKKYTTTIPSSSTIASNSSAKKEMDADDGYFKLCHVEGCQCPHPNEINTALKKLDCTRKNLIAIPPYLHVPDNVIQASFRDNMLSRISNRDFHFVISIEFLDLSRNSISDVELNSFSNFESLHELDLSHNQLQILRPGAFSGLQGLNSLYLDNNKLTSIDPSVFRDLVDLKKFSLKMNPLTILRSDLFEYLKGLEEISLESTKIASLPDTIFIGLKNLKVLDLEGNSFETVPRGALKDLPNLSSLYLSNNPISVLDQGSFPPFKNLHFLFLDSLRNLKEIGPHALGSMPTLSVLHCSHNPELRRIDAEAFVPAEGGSVPHLSLMYLRHNALESLNSSLVDWKSLYMAELSGNPWRCDCDLRWMTSIRIHSTSKTRCAAPPELLGRSFSTLSEDHFQCHSSDLRRWMFLTLCGFLVLASLVVVGVLGVTLVRCSGGRSFVSKQFDYRPVTLTVSDTA